MKRIFTLLLTAALLLSVLAVPAGAYTGNETVPFTEFTDIYDLGEPYVSSIEYLDHHGLMTGTSDTTFSPYQPYTRAMFVTMLGRMENNNGFINESDMLADADRYQGPTGFSDVPQGRWDAPYVKWAAENGIVNGVGNGRFDPTGSITTEQFAAIVGRYLDYLGQTLSWSVNGKPSVYPDIHDLKNVSEYAKDYLIVLLGSGILPYKVDGSGVLVRPQHRLTRAEVAVMFADIFMLVVMNPDFGIEKDTPWGTVESIVQ